MSGPAGARRSSWPCSRRPMTPAGHSAASISRCCAPTPPKPPLRVLVLSKSRTRCSLRPLARKPSEGYEGWDEYAPFYDWENARTLGRRDVPFWRTVALNTGGPLLELGCGTGRISIPLARAGVPIVGIDRSEPMLARARQRVKRAKLGRRVRLVRGDIRFLPFEDARNAARASSSRRSPKGEGGPGFSMVLAPYGMLQSLLRERDLQATLAAVHRVLKKGGAFGVELVADLPSWQEYEKRISLKGWRRRPGGAHVTLT